MKSAAKESSHAVATELVEWAEQQLARMIEWYRAGQGRVRV